MIIELTEEEDKQNLLNEDGFEEIDSNNPNHKIFVLNQPYYEENVDQFKFVCNENTGIFPPQGSTSFGAFAKTFSSVIHALYFWDTVKLPTPNGYYLFNRDGNRQFFINS